MQIKKFEAPTIQEALDTIKRELGPEAIILQTRKNKRGFGLMSKESVEVTAAVSDRSLGKKKAIESKLAEPSRETVRKLPADRLANFYDKHENKYGAQRGAKTGDKDLNAYLEKSARAEDRVELSRRGVGARYIDIMDGTDGGAGVGAPKLSRGGTVEAPAPSFASSPFGGSPASAQPSMMAGPAGQPSTGQSRAADPSVAEELRHLKRMVEELKNAQDEARDEKDAAPGDRGRGKGRDNGLEFAAAAAMLEKAALSRPEFQEMFEQLLVNGLDKRLAFSLVKKAAFELGQDPSVTQEKVMDQVATEIMSSIQVQSPLSGVEARKPGAMPTVLAMVGPTGVGKTTTVAKIASEAILRRSLKVGLINLDSYKVAAFDQLGTYARILNVPFRSVSSVDDLKVALQDFQALDLVLVDTTGRSQRDPESLKEMREMLQTIPGVRSQLVVSATTRDSELYDIASRFSIFRPMGLILSKLDEASIYGCVYNVSQKAKLPLLYFTTGQRVPEDIEEATPERVAALIMDL